MAGHSKWANIRFRKGAQDAKRAKVFTKLLREITTSARIAGIDPDNNPRLRTAIDKALSNNMPKDNIKRAIAKAGGNDDGSSMDEIRYEGYGPSGVAVLVECLTDNRNRTVAEVRHAFSKCGGNLGTDGSVAYLFEKTGVIVCPAGTDEDALMEAALEAGANDVLPQEDGSILVYTDPYAIPDVKQALIDQQFECEQADVDMIASTEVELDATGAEKLMRMTDMLEDLDDVQHVFSNAQISDEVIAELDK